MPRREILELDERGVSKLLVKQRRLPGLRPKIDAAQLHCSGTLLGVSHNLRPDATGAELLFHPNEIGVQPVPINLADQATDNFFIMVCEQRKWLFLGLGPDG